jgi:hypothetical protein
LRKGNVIGWAKDFGSLQPSARRRCGGSDRSSGGRVAEGHRRHDGVRGLWPDSLRRARDLLFSRLVTGRIDVESLGVGDVFGWTEMAATS